MGSNDAHNRANSKYRAKAVARVDVAFYPREQYLYEYVSLQENKAGYIKELLRRDFEAHGGTVPREEDEPSE